MASGKAAVRPGTIIVINGASSSGKTTILRALQSLLAEPFLDAGLDRFLWMLPTRYLDRPLWDGVLGEATRPGEVGRRLVSGMHRAIAALSSTGNNVLADHALVAREWTLECARLFAGLPAYLIGLHCPPEVLDVRERERKDRTPGQASAQHRVVHDHALYDLELDTSVVDPEACATRIAERIRSEPRAFQLLLEYASPSVSPGSSADPASHLRRSQDAGG